MFQSVTAVSNCAFVPVIPTMEVWSPVFVPELVPLQDGAPTINAVIPLTVQVNVGEASGAFNQSQVST